MGILVYDAGGNTASAIKHIKKLNFHSVISVIAENSKDYFNVTFFLKNGDIVKILNGFKSSESSTLYEQLLRCGFPVKEAQQAFR